MVKYAECIGDDRLPKEIFYATKTKDTAGMYPSHWWDGNTKLGEKFTQDDTPPYYCVLNGDYELWTRQKYAKRWDEKGKKKKKNKTAGVTRLKNQQVGSFISIQPHVPFGTLTKRKVRRSGGNATE